MNKNKTLEYYNKNADNFAKTTINVDFYETQNRFSTLLPERGYILDFGCGSGRDTTVSYTHLSEAFYGIPAVLIAECKSRIDKGLMTDVLDEFDHVLGSRSVF